MAKTAKTALVLSTEEEAFIVALRNVIGSADVAESDGVEDDEDEEAEDEELEAPDRETIEGLSIKDLRTAASEYGIDATKKADILAAFEELYEEDEEDEDEDEDEEEAEYDRDELEEMSLKDLRALAKENGASASDVKGLDQDALIDLIMGEADEDEDEEDEEDEEEEDEEVLDEDALKAMSQKDLLALAKELEIKVPAALKKTGAANKKKLVTLILDSGEEEE